MKVGNGLYISLRVLASASSMGLKQLRTDWLRGIELILLHTRFEDRDG